MLPRKTRIFVAVAACVVCVCVAEVLSWGEPHLRSTAERRKSGPSRKLLAISRGEVLAITITGSVVGCCVLSLLVALFVEKRTETARQVMPEAMVRHRNISSQMMMMRC